MSMIATAPGKLILTGEYAVLDGAPALVIAVDRRVVARRTPGAIGSPFLRAVADELAARHGASSPAALAAREIEVDSSAFYAASDPDQDDPDHPQKLGLGSSAAVTVAATALALAAQRDPPRRDEILEIALAAHAHAQGAKGARGSGADVAAAVHGGAIAYTLAPAPIIERHTWPPGVRLVPFFTGVSADTATLVSQVTAARRAHPAAVEAALAAITTASRKACAALAGPASNLLEALAEAGQAVDQLAEATSVALVPPCVTRIRAALRALGGTAKTTGAGGGDVAIAAIPASTDVTTVARALIEAGCQPLQLTVDDRGVDTLRTAQ